MDRSELIRKYQSVRSLSEKLCLCLETEDYVVQPITDVSPPKWHLAHTTWFFERVVLNRSGVNYTPYNSDYYFLFNSYYNSFGERGLREARGSVSRPTVKDVYHYRAVIDQRMQELIVNCEASELKSIFDIIVLGLHHEQQHQELLVTDIKYILATTPLAPRYDFGKDSEKQLVSPAPQMIGLEGGLVEIGAENVDFAWDNEFPKHKVFIQPFEIANRLVTNGEYLEFIEDGGYKNPLLWLSDGWTTRSANEWQAPLYWRMQDNKWFNYRLSGAAPIDLKQPVCHVSYYEADAYARWRGCRLPTEFEWELTAKGVDNDGGNLLDQNSPHPQAQCEIQANHCTQLVGDVWEWTASSYLPYPGYKPVAGPLGEYNGKFMINQMVLRGGSCATPRGHFRSTYRNFFQCEKRWQFSGIRIAK